MRRSIAIIGAGMGGLAAGIYGQLNGYDTQIFEMHTRPGGQAASWKRKGYTFDACIHHFFGCEPGLRVSQLWRELGAMPRELAAQEEITAVVSPDGKMLIDFYDPEKLRKALVDISPADSKTIDQYIGAINLFSRYKLYDTMLGMSIWTMIKRFPALLSMQKWTRLNLRSYAERFSDPFLKRAFALLLYSNPETPAFLHLIWQAGGLKRDIQWPIGGAGELVKSIERRYLGLGGKVHYNSRVAKILVENDKAVGLKLVDGTEHGADIVISDADGRKTILDMLEGKYINDTIRGYCAPITDEVPFAVDIFLGVNRDLSREPSSLVILLKQPVVIANHKYESIEMQLYGFDRTMAPSGKGTIKVELPASYAYWKQLYNDREKYKQEKEKVATQIIQILGSHFQGIQEQVEVIDVTTLMTWERYMGGSQGWFNLPNRKFDFSLREDTSDKNFKTTLPGLSNFYLVGIWATMMASLFNNANSGKTIIRRICRQEKKKFVTSL